MITIFFMVLWTQPRPAPKPPVSSWATCCTTDAIGYVCQPNCRISFESTTGSRIFYAPKGFIFYPVSAQPSEFQR